MTDEGREPWGYQIVNRWAGMTPSDKEAVMRKLERYAGKRYGEGFITWHMHHTEVANSPLLEDLQFYWRAWWTHRGVPIRTTGRRFSRR
jgi:hypothetical protein